MRKIGAAILVLLASIVAEAKSSTQITDDDDETDPELKSDLLRDVDESYLTSLNKNSEAFEGCDGKKEVQAIKERIACNSKPQKAKKHWTSIETAERETLAMLRKSRLTELANYIACNAFDLTWYEIHCEADRAAIDKATLNSFINVLRKDKSLNFFSKAKWVRKTPDMRKFRNPRWVLRSRLTSNDLKFTDPWRDEKHPTEGKTVIMLEQSLDGKIYIAGIPVTGIGTQ